ncbi:MAG: hypothetical protein IJ518_02220 [Clostridia bacterium]|nr:hypothetical protein [Clostridia bacterium]
MSQSSRKQPISHRLISFALVLGVLFYIGYQAYRIIFSGVTTEMAVIHSVYETIETEGLVFRSETAIPPTGSGYTYYVIDNGTRVSKNSVIASVYKDAESGRIEEQVQQIDAQIAALKEIQSEGSTSQITLDVLNDQLHDTVYNYVRSTENGVFDNVEDARFQLLSLLSKKKQLISKENMDFSAKIAKLEQEKNTLKANYQPATSVVRAPVAGYFADRTDGYETVLKTDVLPKLTPEQLKGYLTASPSSLETTSGKIVSGYEWYMACVVPESYYNVLGVGKALSLRMSFVLDDAIPVTVYACNKNNDGELAVVFRCDYMSAELSTIRHETVGIQLVEHTGLRVPKRAIIVNDAGQAGVYVRSGNVVSFRKIEQVYSEAADYVICAEVGEDDYLRLYDDIIVGGRGLYDGKIIA